MGGFEPKVQLFYVKIKGSIIWDIYGGLNLGDDGIQLSRSKNQAGEVIFKKDAWALEKNSIKSINVSSGFALSDQSSLG